MEATGSKPRYQPKTMAQMAEILPGFAGLLTMSAERPSRPIILSNYQPKPMAQLLEEIKGFRIFYQKPEVPVPTIKRKPWTNSTKPIKSVNNTENGQLKEPGVKKKLNFQHNTPVQAAGSSSRPTHNLNAERPKFHMPPSKPNKSRVNLARIDNTPETPIESNKPMKSKASLITNKENFSKCLNANRNTVQAPRKMHTKLQYPKQIHTETPASNVSRFLQKESEVNAIEKNNNLITDKKTLENIPGELLPISTPFIENGNKVSDFFNNSSEMVMSMTGNDDTIMCFDRPSTAGKTVERDESLGALCNLLNNIVNNTKQNTEIKVLEEQAIYNDIERIENTIKTLSNVTETLYIMKETRLKTLKYIKAQKATNKLNEIAETNFKSAILQSAPLPVTNKLNEKNHNDITLTETNFKTEIVQSSPLSVCRTSVIKSPSYKIPKKNLSLARKVYHKSIASLETPDKCNNKAMTMYMKMKEQMSFLNTPVSKDRLTEPCDTPAMTSRNVQMQLAKLFNDN